MLSRAVSEARLILAEKQGTTLMDAAKLAAMRQPRFDAALAALRRARQSPTVVVAFPEYVTLALADAVAEESVAAEEDSAAHVARKVQDWLLANPWELVKAKSMRRALAAVAQLCPRPPAAVVEETARLIEAELQAELAQQSKGSPVTSLSMTRGMRVPPYIDISKICAAARAALPEALRTVAICRAKLSKWSVLTLRLEAPRGVASTAGAPMAEPSMEQEAEVIAALVRAMDAAGACADGIIAFEAERATSRRDAARARRERRVARGGGDDGGWSARAAIRASDELEDALCPVGRKGRAKHTRGAPPRCARERRRLQRLEQREGCLETRPRIAGAAAALLRARRIATRQTQHERRSSRAAKASGGGLRWDGV